MDFPEEIYAARLLVVDDQEDNVVLLQAILEASGYINVEGIQDPRQVAPLHEVNRYDLILLDLSMPYMDGFAVMEALKPLEHDSWLPVLVITAEPEHKLRALEAGARDFLTKPFDPPEVLTRIRNMLEIRLLHKRLQDYRDILEIKVEERTSDLREAEAQVGFLLNFDNVTGLPNRILLRDRFMWAQGQAGAHGAMVGLFIIDVPRLPAVREAFGVRTEQSLVVVVAHRLSAWAQYGDTVARYGDESFAVVAVRQSLSELAAVAGELLTVLDEPLAIENEQIHLDPCIGIAACPGDGDDFDMLIQAAETSSRRARDGGRYQFYTPEMNRSTSDRIKMESALRRAIENDELVLHYQPQADLASGAIIGLEALLRWQHPELGLVLPGKFIALAEETGLIVPMGEWVMREACRQNRAWQDAGLPALPVAVNLSARQFVAGLPYKVGAILAETRLAAACLELELTESLSMNDPESSIDILRTLKRMGVYLSIDDFGTGYSNLSYLKRFPVDKLKLDQSFVRDLTNNVEDLSIARAIIALGHALHLKVIAEGVETEEQRRMLVSEACDEMQGYLFSKPMPADVCAEFLREERRLRA